MCANIDAFDNIGHGYIGNEYNDNGNEYTYGDDNESYDDNEYDDDDAGALMQVLAEKTRIAVVLDSGFDTGNWIRSRDIQSDCQPAMHQLLQLQSPSQLPANGP